jgi:hypothetical protein
MSGGSGFITAADASIVMSAPPIFPQGQIIEGFAEDDVFEVPNQTIAEVRMGVDGFLAAGFIFVLQPWNFRLQASSPSVTFFDDLRQAQKARLTTYFIQGVVSLPSTGLTYALVDGTLREYAPAPSARQVLQSRSFGIAWRDIIPIPFVPAIA